jgi:hypothetical protein
VVLADNNFASIERAVEEGRTIYDDLQKSILFTVPTNAAQVLAILAAVLAGFALPLYPVQILWVNLATAVTLSLAPLQLVFVYAPFMSTRVHSAPLAAGDRLLPNGIGFRIFLAVEGEKAVARRLARGRSRDGQRTPATAPVGGLGGPPGGPGTSSGRGRSEATWRRSAASWPRPGRSCRVRATGAR